MNEPATAVLDIDQIGVEDGFNPRTRFDEESLAELEASIREHGVVQAPTVRPTEDGHYTLIAGERRLIAAKRAGVTRIPVLIRNEADGARAAALAENLIREDLDPIDTARALEELAQAESLGTHAKVAERVKKSPSWVSEHLRLLKLPDEVQQHIAVGVVPVEAQRDLRNLAKVSPRAAECACELVERGRLRGRDLVEHFAETLCEVAEARFEEKPTMIDVRGARLSELVTDTEELKAAAARYLAARPYEEAEDPVIRFGEAEVDAARAAGCLIEHSVDHGGWSSTVAFISDQELAADLALQVVERVEKEGAERAKLTSASASGEPQADGDPEQLKEARRSDREKAKKAAARARSFNEGLGANLLKRRGAKSRKAHGLNRAKALAAIVLEDNPRLAGGGLRLVLSQLQEVEVKSLKSGESREKVSYADAEQCAEYLAKRIESADSAEEVLELLTGAVIAAELADERELPQSRRVGWFNRAQPRARKLLAEEIKEMRPARGAKRG